MSDHESNHSSDREQDDTVDPFMEEALEIVDSQARAERSSATPLPAEAITTSPSAIPIGTTQNRSSYNWLQPRARASPATGTVDPGIRRTPAGIRALSESRQSSMCTLQSGATNRIRANIFKGASAAASAAASSPPARFIHEHHDGASLRPGALHPKTRKMKWTAENDRTLLLVGFSRDIPGIEFQAIADYFKEKPTAKAVQERLTKLRAAQRKVLEDSGIYDADASPATSRAPSDAQTPASLQRRTTPASPATPAAPVTPGMTTPAPDRSSLGGQSSSRPPPGRLPPFPPFTGAGMADGMDDLRGYMSSSAQMPTTNYSSTGRGVGRASSTPFPLMSSMQQQQELLRTYSQQQELLTTTGASQQLVGNATGTADANVSGTAGEDNEDGGEGVDELRRSEMLLEAKNARWEARKHLGGM
jgi:hypothetical protein